MAGLLLAGLASAQVAGEAPARAPVVPVRPAATPAAALKPSALPATAAGDPDGRVRVQLSSRNAVTLSAELAARIATLPLREGDAFREGQVLASFDCALFESQLHKAEAASEAARALLQSSQRLAELNSVGQSELAQAQARLKETQAEVAGARTLVRRCTIVAPFNGRVARRHAAAHQYVTPGTALLDVLESGALEVQMIVPSRWLAWLRPGAGFSVQVDDLARTCTARVQRLGAHVDPVSQSVTVVGLIEGQPPGLLPGMSGWASFPAP